MPWAPKRSCGHPGCPALSDGPYCPAHKPRPWQGAGKGRGGRPWRRIREQVLAEEPFCRLCGAPSEEVDHIRPKANGGSDARENLQGLCRSCHRRKTARR